MSPFSPITAVVMFGVTWKWLCSLVLTDRIHQWKLTGNIPAGQLSCPVRKVTFFKPPPCSSTLPLPSVPFRSLPLVSRCFSCTSRLFFSLSFSPSLSLSFCASGQIIQMLWRTQTPAPIHFPLPVPPSSFLSLSLSHTLSLSPVFLHWKGKTQRHFQKPRNSSCSFMMRISLISSCSRQRAVCGVNWVTLSLIPPSLPPAPALLLLLLPLLLINGLHV